jgi:uncharacterized protein YecE (DUF72 family)
LGDKVISVLTIYAAEINYFNEAEIALLGAEPQKISILHLHTFQQRERRRKAEAEMRKLQQAIDQSSACGSYY